MCALRYLSPRRRSKKRNGRYWKSLYSILPSDGYPNPKTQPFCYPNPTWTQKLKPDQSPKLDIQNPKTETQKPGPITNLTRNLAHKSRFVRSIAVPRAPSVTTFWVDWNTHTHFLVIWKVNPRTTWGIANGLKRFWGWRNVVPRGEKNVYLLNWIYILCKKQKLCWYFWKKLVLETWKMAIFSAHLFFLYITTMMKHIAKWDTITEATKT